MNGCGKRWFWFRKEKKTRQCARSALDSSSGIHCGPRSIRKRWWILNRKLEIEPDRAEANRILDEMESILQEELGNAEETLPLVENDSRLGWEPSMEYMCDPEHIQWKIAQVKRVIENILPAYRKTINL